MDHSISVCTDIRSFTALAYTENKDWNICIYIQYTTHNKPFCLQLGKQALSVHKSMTLQWFFNGRRNSAIISTKTGISGCQQGQIPDRKCTRPLSKTELCVLLLIQVKFEVQFTSWNTIPWYTFRNVCSGVKIAIILYWG